MLVTMKEILDDASKNNYGVIAPNIFSELDARACVAAAEEMNSPLILDISVGHTKDIVLFGSYIRCIAEESRLPIALNLDHGGSFEKSFEQVTKEIMSALKGGFSSVMVDRSYLPFEQNIQETAILTKMAHSLGVSVEAEIGHVGSGTAYDEEDGRQYTDPKVAKEFVERTGVDCLAVSVGTAHGLYTSTPELKFDLIKEIKKEVNGLPLVVHGGSGSGHENLCKACHCGINKVNICYEIVERISRNIQSEDLSGLKAYNFYALVQTAVIEMVSELMEVFGSKDKAWTPERQTVPGKGRLLDFVGDAV